MGIVHSNNRGVGDFARNNIVDSCCYVWKKVTFQCVITLVGRTVASANNPRAQIVSTEFLYF